MNRFISLGVIAFATAATFTPRAAQAGNAKDVPKDAPIYDYCDKVRDTFGTCVLQTARGDMQITFGDNGLPFDSQITDRHSGDGYRLQTYQWITSPTKYGPVIEVENIAFQSHTSTTEQPTNGATDHLLQIYRVHVTLDIAKRYLLIEQHSGGATDRCEIWGKSAEGDTSTALVAHGDGASKQYVAWWDGKSPFPFQCGRFLPYTADASIFAPMFARYANPSDAAAFTNAQYNKVGVNYDPAQYGVFNGLSATHQLRISKMGRSYELDLTLPWQGFLNEVGTNLGLALVAGGTAAAATSPAGPEVALPAGYVATALTFDTLMIKSIHDLVQKRIDAEQKELDDKAKEEGRPQSQTETDDGDDIDQSLIAAANADGENGDSPTNMDGSSDPSGGAWNAGDGSDINVPTGPSGNDPWCPTMDCDNGGGSFPVNRPARPIPVL